MVSNSESPPPDVARIAAGRHLGQCTSVHRVGSALRTIVVATAVVVGLFALLRFYDAIGIANLLLSIPHCFGMILAIVFLATGLVHIGEAVYLYQEGLVHVDRISVTAIRFDEIRLLEQVTRRAPEAMLGRVSYRIAGGGYWVRVTGLVDGSAAFGRRLEDEVRRHGGIIK
jgi:hypothetical protein